MENKVCRTCDTSKPINAFYKAATGKPVNDCKPCYMLARKSWKENLTPERRYRYSRASTLAAYSMTIEQYEEMLGRQGGKCASCRSSDPGRGDHFAVDHDHRCCPGKRSCGKCIRGLLCIKCNSVLGLLDDDPDKLAALIAYLTITIEG
jgi:recombination endonuclease VII